MPETEQALRRTRDCDQKSILKSLVFELDSFCPNQGGFPILEQSGI